MASARDRCCGGERRPARLTAILRVIGVVGVLGLAAGCGSGPATVGAASATASVSPVRTPASIGAARSVAARPSPPRSVAPRSIPAPHPSASSVVVAAQANTAIAMSALLAVKGRAPMTGYSRAAFGPAWEDVAHDGCDTRDDILSAQLDRVRFLDRCRVASGSEIDPYTGAALFYVRGHSTVDIDHVVSLGDAWQTGAQRLSPARREALANDPLNLLAVSSALNRSKGDSDAASWLPPMKSYRCAYVARQVAVKHRYALWVTGAEHDAFTRILATCPTQVAPTTGASRAPAPATTGPAPIPTPTRTTPARTTPAPPPSTRAPAAPLVVHPGSFCAPAGATGVTVAGTAMICGPASDGRNRWHHA